MVERNHTHPDFFWGRYNESNYPVQELGGKEGGGGGGGGGGDGRIFEGGEGVY